MHVDKDSKEAAKAAAKAAAAAAAGAGPGPSTAAAAAAGGPPAVATAGGLDAVLAEIEKKKKVRAGLWERAGRGSNWAMK